MESGSTYSDFTFSAKIAAFTSSTSIDVWHGYGLCVLAMMETTLRGPTTTALSLFNLDGRTPRVVLSLSGKVCRVGGLPPSKRLGKPGPQPYAFSSRDTRSSVPPQPRILVQLRCLSLHVAVTCRKGKGAIDGMPPFPSYRKISKYARRR